MTDDPRIGPDGKRPGFRRVLLKLGGEMFGGGAVGVDPGVVEAVARQIAEVVATGAQMAVVIGGGNFFRGSELQERGMDRARADYMGMLGTVMNCLALQDFLEREHLIDTRVQTAISLCMDNAMPIVVFNLLRDGNIARAAAGEKIGTLISQPV